jgi:hypothetical protein
MKWLPIKGYEKRYEVSDLGDVRSTKWTTPRKLHPFADAAGYLRVNLYSGTKSSMKMHFIHDLVAEAFIEPKPPGLTVNHKDGVKTNNSVSNLEYLSLSDNLRHAHRTGLINNRGESNGQAKLTEPDVYMICSGLWSGQTVGDTAQSYAVSVSTVCRIWAGKGWIHHTSTFGQYMPSGLM